MIGFEFETFMLLKARAALIGSTTPVIEGQVDGKKGWHVSPDMRSPIDPETNQPYPDLVSSWKDGKEILPKYSGYGDLEFITQPFVESAKNEDGLQGLLRVVQQIKQATMALEEQGIACDIPLKLLLKDKAITWGEHAGKNFKQDDDIVVYIPKSAQMETGRYKDYVQKSIYASVQMTAGIKLERIPYLFYRLAQPNSRESKLLLARFGADPTWNTNFSDALLNAQKAVKGSFPVCFDTENDPHYNRYLGAVAFLAHVIRAGKTAEGLEQAKYLSPMLSRTNLGKLASVYQQVGKDFKAAVLTASQRKDTELLFPLSPLLKKITVDGWLDNLIQGNDPISWGQVRTGTDPRRWDPQKVGAPGKEDVGHVFEFRAMGNASYINWDKTVEEHFQIIADLNASTEQIPW